MSRNAESRFAINPTDLDMRRSRMPIPFNHKFTMDTGDLVPAAWFEILPGDTVQMSHADVVRMSTLIDPVMDNAYLDTYWFFVPMRLCWEHTKEFFGENSQGPWYPDVEYTIPQIKMDGGVESEGEITIGDFWPGTVVDYLGVPPFTEGVEFNAIPVRAYNICYRDWFYSEALQSPPNIYLGDSLVNFDPTDPVKGGKVYKSCKLHDYFTSLLPAPQRGPAVSFQLAGDASISIPARQVDVKATSTLHVMSNNIKFGNGTNTMQLQPVTSSYPGDDLTGHYPIESGVMAYEGISVEEGGISTSYTGSPANRSNLIVNIPATSSVPITGIDPISVNDLRMAFQMQRFYERSAMFGGRYTEFLKAQFSVTSPDARLQRSEYLGGNRVPLNVNQVEQNSPTDGSPLGTLGAYSHTADSNQDFVHSFTEHGILMCLVTVRYNHSYPQGLQRALSRKTMWDYYLPVMANIGNQPVLRKELFCTGSDADDQVFGYSEAWADYRYANDRVSGMFRPDVTGNLASWHYADNYSTSPYLSAEWIKEDKTNVDRTLAVTSDTHPQLICDFQFSGIWTRCMPLYSIPGLIDHH